MNTVIRAALLYWLMLAVLRVIPRRVGNNATPFEFILLFLLGGMAIQSVVGDDRSFVNALSGVATVALMHTLVATLKQHSETFGKLADGTPEIIFEEGRWHEDRMHRQRVQIQDVMTQARQNEITTIDQLRLVVVERNGAISIFKKDGEKNEA